MMFRFTTASLVRLSAAAIIRLSAAAIIGLSFAAVRDSSAAPPDPFFDFVVPWDDAQDAATSLLGLNEAPAGGKGFVVASPDGHLAVAGTRVRFWGVNLCFGANFPDKTAAPTIAVRLAKLGVNLVRFHHMDNQAAPGGIWKTTRPERELDADQLDRLDFFIARLKERGIYADLNLLVSRPFQRGTELHPDIDKIDDWKLRATLGFFDPDVLELQKKYARDLLTHRNPYTGTRYVEEPAVAFIEINNENGLVQAFLSGDLDALPPHYRDGLKAAWNAWLSARHASQAALARAWKAESVPLGAEILANGDFSSGSLSGWNLENHQGAAAAAAIEPGGPGGGRALRLSVSRTGSAGWHVQCNQPRLSLAGNSPYTLSFYAKADAARAISVDVGMAHDPWQNLGFSAQLELTREWKRFEFSPFMLRQSDANARLNFTGMGLAAQTVWFADVSLRPGGSVGLAAGETLGGPGIGLFAFRGAGGRTNEALTEWYEFLLETESRYWKTMSDYCKSDLKARPLVFGTIVGCSTPTLQAALDAIDTHSYWNHPVFPNRAWDWQDWYVRNTAMVNRPLDSTLTGLFGKRVKGKPHCLTEYNHSFPNTFEAEGFPLVALYAGLQDWDVVVPFAYSHRSNDWDTRRTTSFFDIDQNPVKLASFLTAALAFRRADVKPARDEYLAALDRGREAELLRSGRAWQLVDAQTAGLDPAAGFVSRVGVDLKAKSSRLPELKTDRAAPLLASDTGELVWDASRSGRGLVTADTARTKMAVGFCGGRRIDLGGVVIEAENTVQSGFCVVAVNVLEGDSFGKARRLLVTALGTQENTGVSWYRYPRERIDFPPAEGENVTLRGDYGRAPSRVEGVKAAISLPYPAARLKAWALDPTGARVTALPVKAAGGSARLEIGPQYKTVWYEVEVGG